MTDSNTCFLRKSLARRNLQEIAPLRAERMERRFLNLRRLRVGRVAQAERIENLLPHQRGHSSARDLFERKTQDDVVGARDRAADNHGPELFLTIDSRTIFMIAAARAGS